MSAQTDFYLTLDRAAGLLSEAACSVRAVSARPLPQPHRRLIGHALRGLESAQQDLFQARNDPWHQPSRTKPRQLELL